MKIRKKQDYIWNTASGLLNAAEAVVMSMIVTRITGLSDAGILTIAFAIGNLMMTIGKFGVRNFQVTDSKRQYSFGIYLKTRMLTVIAMFIITVSYLLYACIVLNYDNRKVMTIFLICMIYEIESVEDVFGGFYQQKNHLAIGAKLFCARWMSILIVFFVGLVFLNNLVVALFFAFLTSIFIEVIMIKKTYSKVCMQQERVHSLVIRKEHRKEICSLLMAVFPLFGSNFLSFYVNNSPKYAIDACMTDDIQACYGFVTMPVFVIGLLNNFIYQPTLIYMAEEWKEGKTHQVLGRIQKQLLIIIGIMIICLLGAYVWGIPVLSILYHTDLGNYKKELLILLVAGGLLAISGYMGVVLTIMRCQKDMLISYGMIAFIAFVGLKYIVELYGTLGAAFAYAILMFFLCFIYGGILFYRIQRHSI